MAKPSKKSPASAWIARKREANGLTQDDLAKLVVSKLIQHGFEPNDVSCSVDLIKAIEIGKQLPGPRIALGLALALGVDEQEREAFVLWSRGSGPQPGVEVPYKDAPGYLMRLVRKYWIEGVRDKSLHFKVHLDLGIELRPELLAPLWDVRLPHQDDPQQPLPEERKIIDVFDDCHGKLLIVGAPGAGKTTMLLDLADSLLERAERDRQLPVPVIFNLASWTQRCLPLDQWITEELNLRYHIPKRNAQAWIETEYILPLLDGLDEVPRDRQDACVAAINEFRQLYGLLPIVVCCRIADLLEGRLQLDEAVMIRSLTREQIMTYLNQIGPPMAGVLTVLKDDHTLWELLETPLMLSIVTLAYKNKEPRDIQMSQPVEQRHEQLFTDYIENMLDRPKPCLYAHIQTQWWLARLAAEMQRHGITIFHIESLQRSWLPTRLYQNLYVAGTGLAVSLSLGLAIGTIVSLSAGWSISMGVGLIIGLVRGLVSAIRAATGEIRSVEELRWSWANMWRHLPQNVLSGVSVGLLGGLGGGLLSRLLGGPSNYLIFGLSIGLWGGLFTAAIFSVLSGWSGATEPEQLRLLPNQGIRRSAINAIPMAMSTGLATALAGTCIGWFADRATGGASNWMLIGMLSGLVGGLIDGWLRNGGEMALRHSILRLLLWHGDLMPRDYAHFLNYAVDRIFLQHVGGGYRFIHRLLLEHFASLPNRKR